VAQAVGLVVAVQSTQCERLRLRAGRYGQTGTGKTYTMEGLKDEDGALRTEGPDCGIIVRAVRRHTPHALGR